MEAQTFVWAFFCGYIFSHGNTEGTEKLVQFYQGGEKERDICKKKSILSFRKAGSER
ncbi:hypothetical protein [Pedobacter miscanthi]|uniref:hypothetical protein n=1 Tax=Pedobacter miscanthi TaxID=2259170 RepID=UPI00292FBAFE|nr:hypothetical protein [Pedobacter miscanthi]